jgi:hypothetical protein
MVCPEAGLRYKEVEPGKLPCLDWDEDAALPSQMTAGKKAYVEFKGVAQKPEVGRRGLRKSGAPLLCPPRIKRGS